MGPAMTCKDQERILEAEQLLAWAAQSCSGDVEAVSWIRGALSALHWASGCPCEAAKIFDRALLRFRAEADQAEAKAVEARLCKGDGSR
jgi:hypothetical protein